MSALSILARRAAWALPTLVLVIALTFALMRAAPGGPFDSEKKIPEAIRKELMAQYRLDGPFHAVFADYLASLARGDLRLSTKYRNRTVNEILAQTLPVSMALGSVAFLLAVGGGTLAGALAAATHRRAPDYAIMLLAAAGISLPSFVLAPLLIAAFAFGLAWFPVGGWGAANQIVLPAFALSLPYAAAVARLVRTSMLEVLSADYIRAARAKGVPQRRVIFAHALRNAALPLVSYSGPLAANILTGSLVVETVFRIPGVGPFFVNGVLSRDVFLVGGVTLVYSAMLIFFNALVDAAYTVLDKRIRLE